MPSDATTHNPSMKTSTGLTVIYGIINNVSKRLSFFSVMLYLKYGFFIIMIGEGAHHFKGPIILFQAARIFPAKFIYIVPPPI